jgi:hypothetical protein
MIGLINSLNRYRIGNLFASYEQIVVNNLAMK